MKKILCTILILLCATPLFAMTFTWQQDFGGATLSDAAFVRAVTSDPSGNVIITGEFQSDATGISFGGANLINANTLKDIFVAKYNSSGAHQWSFKLGTTGTDDGYGIGTDSSGNIYITGQFQGTVDFDPGAGTTNLISNGNADVFLAKYSSAGALVWAKNFGGTGDDVGFAISVMSNGTNVITGKFGAFGNGTINFGGGVLTTAGNEDIFVATFDTDGNHVWSKSTGGPGADIGLSVAISTTGAVVATGYFNNTIQLGCGTISSAGLADGVILAYSSTGVRTWVRRMGGTSDDRGIAVAINSSGEVVVTGTFDTTINLGGGLRPGTTGGGPDIFLVKYTSNGGWMWDNEYGSVQGFGDGTAAITIDSSSNIIITGAMLNALNFGGGSLTGGGSYDAFLAKFTTAGVHISSLRFRPSPDTLHDEHGYGVAVDTSGNIFIGGDFDTDMNLGGGNMTSPGGFDGFLGKFAP